MVKEVVPDMSCLLALFTYYNPILKHGVTNFMSVVKEAGAHGLVVPDVPLEETDILRSGAAKNTLSWQVLLKTPTERMGRITKASEGFVYLWYSSLVRNSSQNYNGLGQFTQNKDTMGC
ncbi:tryptophan synthase alpha chain-like [Aegilops tauschii subsp. strangulata]|uniref:tryptophan synthase alpha chain-like n=1 Tax=Aegilops tauschii subsp. strangulata TaxID=200361 RepID=UPI003CC8B7E2